MRHARAFALFTAVLLAGCATFPLPEVSEPEAPAQENTAVAALMKSARDDMSAGRLAAAAANVERALRIEPRNPDLWHELARINLHQGQPTRAAQFAAKSNALAGEDVALRAANWRLIGQARTQNGDHTGAEAAFAEAAALDRRH